MKKVARLRITQNEEAANAGGTEHIGVRTTGRIKKPKAVFDPSDNYLPRSQRGNVATSQSSGTGAAVAGTSILIERKRDVPTMPQGQENKRTSQSLTATSTTKSANTTTKPQNTTTKTPPTTTATTPDPSPETIANTDICDVCQKREAKRGTHARNKLISCLDCERRVHKLCLPVDFEDIDILRQNYRCDNCRTCDVCDAFADCEPKINQPMVTCSKCIKSYHLTCHIPNVFKFQQIFRWKCNKCVPVVNNGGNVLPVKTIREIIGDEPKRTPPPQQEQQPPEQLQQHQQNVNIAAAAEEAKCAAAAAKRTLQDAKSNDNAPQKTTNGGRAETDMDSVGGSSVSTSSTSSNSDSSSSTSSNNTRRSVEVKGVAEATAPKKQKTNNEVIAINNVNTPTPVIRYSPYEPIDVPDVKDWNVDQVASYFAKYFPNEAHVFKEHEIDGTSLLLLKRSDVIKKLPIKLGPSLRIYSLILKIQTQLNDPTLGWNCGL